jgi:hypothetical protein
MQDPNDVEVVIVDVEPEEVETPSSNALANTSSFFLCIAAVSFDSVATGGMDVS